MSRFLETLTSGRVLLMDGAMGTELQRAGIGESECYEAWNLTQPEKVRAIHQAYVDAGAEVLLTNTFQANVPALSKHGLADKLELIIDTAVGLARSIAAPHQFVLATFGPTPPKGDMVSFDLDEMARRLRSAREADGWLFETMSTIADLSLGVHCEQHWLVDNVRPLLASWTYLKATPRGIQTLPGQSTLDCATSTTTIFQGRLLWPPWPEQGKEYVLGVNCGRDIGMDEIIEIVRCYRRWTDLPLFARPNAGTPTRVGDRWVYPLTPEKMAERLPQLLEAGVSMVGGCCGTTPEHIAAMRPIVDAWNAKRGFGPSQSH